MRETRGGWEFKLPTPGGLSVFVEVERMMEHDTLRFRYRCGNQGAYVEVPVQEIMKYSGNLERGVMFHAQEHLHRLVREQTFITEGPLEPTAERRKEAEQAFREGFQRSVEQQQEQMQNIGMTQELCGLFGQQHSKTMQQQLQGAQMGAIPSHFRQTELTLADGTISTYNVPVWGTLVRSAPSSAKPPPSCTPNQDWLNRRIDEIRIAL